jgi:hypothetical protein
MEIAADGWIDELGMKHAKPVTKLDLGYKLNTMDSKTKLCKRLKAMVMV